MIIEIANAASDIGLNMTRTYEIDDVIRVAIAVVVFFSWLLSVFFIIWWWVMLILSWGKEDKTKPAINSIRYAALWLIIVILAIFLWPKIGDILWLNISNYISPAVIFDTIQELSEKILWSKNDINFDSGSPSWTELPADFSDL